MDPVDNEVTEIVAEIVAEEKLAETPAAAFEMDPIDRIQKLIIKGSTPTILQPMICSDVGQILGYEERWNLSAEIAADASHSMSMNRAPDPLAFGLATGKRGNLPFLPGGFEADIDEALKKAEVICTDDEKEFLEPKELLNTPPGFSEAVHLPETLERPKTPLPMLPPGIVSNKDTSMVDNLLSKEIDGDIVEKLRPAFKSVVITNEEESTTVDEDPIAEVKNDEPEIDETEDLVKIRNANSEFTHAKFLDEAKVAKRFDEQIRPIMAKTYPFELDMFQKQAIVSMEASDSVFVAAHTSAGKTVVAEYAIALSQIHKTRVIYTSPIKALSNQKFREFKLLFGDVGLITGDIQLNTDAFCLIMTTEVLRSMLYNGSEVIRELEWVIFDEVHYINDQERGYVWEESLIMLPSHVSIVMLSATVPNCVEFADWVGRIKQRQITVIQTLKRPVPLEHFIYTGHSGKTQQELFKIMDKEGVFLKHGYQKAVQAKSKIERVPDPRYQQQGGNQNQRGGKGGSSRGGKFSNHQMLQTARAIANGGEKKKSNYQVDRSVYSNLTAFLRKEKLLPVVVFVFSRKRCDDAANMMMSSDLTTQTEKHEIHKFFDKCIDRLNGSDKILPQVTKMRELSMRGFAVHHSGILPILKEVVELLFQRGLVKVLFATETFAMGVNMPARTVVFDAVEKFDGVGKRPLNATEYTQMAGRAGRRGLDETGIVITLAKQTVAPITDFTSLLTGKAVSLDSQFRVTYAMLLKLLRVEQFQIEDMLQRSYVERSSLRLVVSRKKQITELSEQIRDFPLSNCEECSAPGPDYTRQSIDEHFYNLDAYFNNLADIWPTLMNTLTQKILIKGRVIIVNYPPLNLAGRVAVVLDTVRNEHGHHVIQLFIPASEDRREQENLEIKSFNALSDEEKSNRTKRLRIVHAAKNGLYGVQQPSASEKSYRVIYDFDPSNILAICKQNINKMDPKAIIAEDKKRTPTARPQSPDRSVLKVIVELDMFAERWSYEKAPVYKLVSDIKIKEYNSYINLQQFIQLQERLENDDNYPCKKCPFYIDHFILNLEKANLTNKLDTLRFQTSNKALILSEEYRNRLHLLRTLDYIDKDNMIGLKGKIACEISHLEVLVTELLFENKFDGKSCAELAAMLSPMTCQFTHAGNKDVDAQMEFKHPVNFILRAEVVEAAERIDFSQQSCRVTNSFVMDELRFGLMDVVYEWASGTPFSDIMLLTQCQEGLIVRCIQRLDEVLKDIRNAARIIGNPLLYEKMEETSTLIKRDIVFAASLYTSSDE